MSGINAAAGRVFAFALVGALLVSGLLGAPVALAATDAFEPNGEPLECYGPLLDGQPYTSYIWTENDVDYYRIHVLAPMHLDMHLDVPDDRHYRVALYGGYDWNYPTPDTYGSPLLTESPYGDVSWYGRDHTVSFTIQTPGTYYIKVYGVQWLFEPTPSYSQTKTYTLTVQGDWLSPVGRISGEDRIETAIRVSERAFPDPESANVAVIATARNFPDALAGAVLAEAWGGPLLLTDPDRLDWAVEQELNRLGVIDVYILGGTGAVGENVEDQLNTDYRLAHRIAGQDRYETASLVASAVKARSGSPARAILATGEGFADALAASPYAAARQYPIVLTAKSSLSVSARAALQNLGVSEVLVMGGEGAVSTIVENQVEGMGIAVTRVAGDTRVGTAAAMAEVAVGDGFTMDRPMMATGWNFPDALAGGALGARTLSPLLLTDPRFLSSETEDLLVAHVTETEEITVLGGAGAVSLAVLQDAHALY